VAVLVKLDMLDTERNLNFEEKRPKNLFNDKPVALAYKS